MSWYIAAARKLGWADPAPVERRLHLRLVEYWESLRKDRPFVPLDGFDFHGLENESNHGFLIDLRGAAPRFVYIGPVLRQEAGLTDDAIPALFDIPPKSLLGRFAGRFTAAVESAGPVTAEDRFTTEANFRILCRAALVPLSSDGKHLDHVYGAISWKNERVGDARP